MNTNLFLEHQDAKKTIFCFGGFYESKHDAIIESNIESKFDCDESLIISRIDYKKTYLNYVNSYLDLLDKEFKTNFKESFLELSSPDFYNYVNDAIILDNSKFNQILQDIAKNQNQKFIEFCDSIENFLDLEFDIELNKLNQDSLNLIEDIENLKENNEMWGIIKENFETLETCDLEDFKQSIIDLFDYEIIYYDRAMDYLKENDNSLQTSLELAQDLGYQPKNLNSETLASLLNRHLFLENLNNYDDELERVRVFLACK